MSRWTPRLVAAAVIGLVGAVLPLPRFHLTTVYDVDRVVPTVQTAAAETLPSAGQSTVTMRQDGIEPFTTFGLDARVVPSTSPAVRFHQSDGTWSDWHDVEIDSSSATDPGSKDRSQERAQHGTDHHVSDPIWVKDATGYELRLPRAASRSLQVLLVREHQRQAQIDAAPAPPASSEETTYGAPPVHTRAEWGARPPKNAPAYASELKMGVVHHSDTGNGYTPADVPAILRSIQAFHMDANGWADIGYNFAVDRFGGIWEARAGGITSLPVGAHVGGFNTGSTGVVVLGEFTTAQPTSASIDSVSQLLGWKLWAEGVDPNSAVNYTSGGSTSIPAGQVVTIPRVIGHRDVDATSCPGQMLWNQLTTIRAKVAARVAQLNAETAPVGHVDIISGGPGQITISGWAWDPDLGGPATVDVTALDRSATLSAGATRADVAAAYPWIPASVGFSTTLIGLPAGNYPVCVTVRNPGPGPDVNWGCVWASVSVPSTGPPVGGIAGANWSGPGSATVTGWALDPDLGTAPTSVQITSGAQSATGPADQSWSGLGTVYPAAGDNHRFAVTLPNLGGGQQTLCATALNSGPGVDAGIGCRTVYIPTGNPIGGIDYYTTGIGAVHLWGWALDPDSTASLDVAAFVGGSMVWAKANLSRSDVATQYPGFGPAHGWNIDLGGLPGGVQQICVSAANVGPGLSASLGCVNANVPDGSPVGALDYYAVGPGSVDLYGWDYDPDTDDPVATFVYVDDRTVATYANLPRTDLAGRIPTATINHGYHLHLDGLTGGPHTMCVSAFNRAGAGNTVTFRCIPIMLPTGLPIGHVDYYTAKGGAVDVWGWAVDPDDTGPVSVFSYVDSLTNSALANLPRADLAAQLPAWGPAHGYHITVGGVAPGPHTLCTFAFDHQSSGVTNLGCLPIVM